MSRFYILLLSLLAAGGCMREPAGPSAVVRQVNIVAKKYEFQPSTVHLRLGETVMLHITTADVQHGFAVPDLNIHESIQPGVPTDVTFRADRRGHFRIDCYIKCGPGHDDMSGEIVVE
jgi:cytochrome c oxidase subunit 2